MSVLLAATAALLFGIGTYLLLQRKLSRIIIGLSLISHGANVLIITSGRRGLSPLIGSGDPDDMADPLPQALALTAIVITFGVTALLLALAYRSWLLTEDDEVADDLEDRLVARHGHVDRELADDQELSDAVEATMDDSDDGTSGDLDGDGAIRRERASADAGEPVATPEGDRPEPGR